MAATDFVKSVDGREASVAREFMTFSIGEVLDLGATGTQLTVRRIDRREGYVLTEVTKLGCGDSAAEMYLNQSIRLAPAKREGSWLGMDGPQEMNQLHLLIRGQSKFLGTLAASYD